jgi:hypothetical protein
MVTVPIYSPRPRLAGRRTRPRRLSNWTTKRLSPHGAGLAADAVDAIGVVLHVKPLRPVIDDAGRRELLG